MIVPAWKDDTSLMFLFYIGMIIAIGGLGLMIYDNYLQGEQNNLNEQNPKDVINSWNCDDLGDNILTQIKNNNSTFLDYQKDLYHFKCEVKP